MIKAIGNNIKKYKKTLKRLAIIFTFTEILTKSGV